VEVKVLPVRLVEFALAFPYTESVNATEMPSVYRGVFLGQVRRASQRSFRMTTEKKAAAYGKSQIHDERSVASVYGQSVVPYERKPDAGGRRKVRFFTIGFASAFDLSGQMFLEVHGSRAKKNAPETGFKRRGGRSLAGDLQRIGKDMRRAINEAVGER